MHFFFPFNVLILGSKWRLHIVVAEALMASFPLHGWLCPRPPHFFILRKRKETYNCLAIVESSTAAHSAKNANSGEHYFASALHGGPVFRESCVRVKGQPYAGKTLARGPARRAPSDVSPN